MLSGAAPLDEALGGAVQDRLGARVLQGYGMTEMSPISHVIPRDRDDISIGSIGLTVPNAQMKIVDTLTGHEVPMPEVEFVAPRSGPATIARFLGDELRRVVDAR